MAYVTGVVLAFMTVVGLPFKYLMGQSATWYSVGWVGHGWLYVLYVLAAIDLATRCRWGFVRSVLVLLAGTVPFMSFVAEHYVTKDVKARLEWLKKDRAGNISPTLRTALEKYYGKEGAAKVQHVEAFEICEYGKRPSAADIKTLFPFLP